MPTPKPALTRPIDSSKREFNFTFQPKNSYSGGCEGSSAS